MNNRQITDMCQLLNMCPNPDVPSDNFHWTQALPVLEMLHNNITKNYLSKKLQFIEISYDFGI